MTPSNGERWVVVGAGSGGCVAARRLLDAGHDVVLLEAGPDLLPGRVPPAIDGDDAFAALGLEDRVEDGLVALRTERGTSSTYLRGRGVGGSSVVNMMLARRGSPSRYDSWGWDRTEVDAAWSRVLVPEEAPTADEWGRVDVMLRQAAPDAEVCSLTRQGKRRVTSAEAYLWPVRDPGSSAGRLEVVAHARVSKVRVDAAGSAVGVTLADGRRIDADAVVLSAGAIHTPAILQRSGVDDAGDGLVDHPAVGLLLELKDAASLHRGGLVSSVVVERDGVQVLAVNHLGPTAPAHHAMLLVAVMDPESPGGRVQIDTDDPLASPRVDFELLTSARDRERLAGGVEFVRELLSAEPFASAVGATYVDDAGTTIERLDSAERIARWMLEHGADYVHAACSSASVVDRDGQVLGHERLFVCDASAFPAIPDANTHLPTTMLAERLCARWLDGPPA